MAGEGGGGGGGGSVGFPVPSTGPAQRPAHEARGKIREAARQYAREGGSPNTPVYYGAYYVGTVGEVAGGAPILGSPQLGQALGITLGALPGVFDPGSIRGGSGGARYGFGPRPLPQIGTPGINPGAPPPPGAQVPRPTPAPPPPVPTGWDFWGFLDRLLGVAGQVAPNILDWFRRGSVQSIGQIPVAVMQSVVPGVPGGVQIVGGDVMATNWGSIISAVGSGISALAQQYGGTAGMGYMPGGSIVGIAPMGMPPLPAPVGGSQTTPFRATAGGRAVAQTWFAPNPVTGRLEFFRPAGRPLIFSRDLATVRMVERIGRRFAPRGSRRATYRRRRRRLGG